MKLLTITIAAYNVEDYLEDTLSSLYKSEFLSEFEVLVVDDGSKDKTSEIGKKYQDLAPQTFKYIKKENGGHGSTINKGIELATGKYFKVIDGDDWVNTRAFDQFILKLKNADTDMILTEHIGVYPDRKEPIKMVHNLQEGIAYSMDTQLDLSVSLHTISVKTNLLRQNQVRILENVFYDDAEYVIWSIFVSKNFLYYNLPIYMYRKGNENQSASKQNMIKNIEMQKIMAYRLVTLDNMFIKQISVNKQKVILKTIIQSVGGTMRTFMLLDDKRKAKEDLKKFDLKIKSISSDIYIQLNSSKFILLTRFRNYMLLPIIRFAYKTYINFKR